MTVPSSVRRHPSSTFDKVETGAVARNRKAVQKWAAFWFLKTNYRDEISVQMFSDSFSTRIYANERISRILLKFFGFIRIIRYSVAAFAQFVLKEFRETVFFLTSFACISRERDSTLIS